MLLPEEGHNEGEGSLSELRLDHFIESLIIKTKNKAIIPHNAAHMRLAPQFTMTSLQNKLNLSILSWLF